MQFCKFCEAALPPNARFCAYCGHTVDADAEKTLGIGALPTVGYISPGVISNLSPPARMSDGENQDTNLTHDEEKEKEDEEERRRLLGLPLLGLLAEGQAPAASVPMVQGTPQVAGVPTVENPSPLHERDFSPAHQHQHAAAHQHQHAQPASHLHASALRPAHRQPKVHHVVRARLFTVTVSSLVIVAGVISALVFLLPTTISLVGSSTVTQGATLHLHGEGFLPGTSVRLTLDNNQPLSVVGQSTPQQANGVSAYAATVLQVLVVEQFPSSGKTIQVGLNGTFDATITVNQSWSLGQHTIHATEDVSSLAVQSTELTFQIVPQPAHLIVAPVSLDFGMLKQGSKASQTVTLSNTGQQPLSWEVSVGTAQWLTLATSAGTLQPGTSEPIQVTANTAKLAAGHYSTTLSITTGIETMQVPVLLAVTLSPTPTPIPQPQTCPSGLVGTPPNCYQPAPQTCPSGLVGTPPNCYQPAPQTCPSGLVGTPPNCYRPAPQTCPSGLVGTPPNCYQPAPQHCPSGLVGTPPNCHQPQPQTCPEGQVGTPPDCQQPQQPMCPSGETGTPPNCVVPHPCTFSCGNPTCEPPLQPVPYPPYCAPQQDHPSCQQSCGGQEPSCQPPNQPLPYPPYCGPPQY